MKKHVGLSVGILVLLLLLAGYFFLSHKNAKKDPVPDEKITAFETKMEDLSSISILDGDKVQKFVKREDAWTVEGMEEYSLDESKTEMFLSKVSRIEASRVLEDPEHPEDFGIDPPVIQVVLTDTHEKTRTLEFGAVNDATNSCYMTVDGDLSKVYMTETVFAQDLRVDPMTLVKQEDFPNIPGNSIKDVTIEKDGASFSLKESEENGISWTVTDWEGKEKQADGAAISEYMNKISGLSWTEMISKDSSDLAAYGLDHPDKISVHYTVTKETSEEEEEPVTEDKTEVLWIGTLTDQGTYYGKLESQNGIYTISESAIQGLLDVNGNDFLGQFVAPYHFADLDRVSIEYKGEIHNYDKKTEEKIKEEEEEPVTITSYYMDGKEIEIEDFLDFYGKITEMGFQERLDEKPETTEIPAMKIHFYKEKGTDVTVEYIPYDTNFYIVKDDKENYSKVNKMVVKEMLESYDAFLKTIAE